MRWFNKSLAMTSDFLFDIISKSRFMRNLVLILLIVFTTNVAFSQNDNRIRISGVIQVPPEDEKSGIGIFNMTADRGTVTNPEGEFNIPVTVNDTLRISSIQFQEFLIVIDKGVVDSGQLKIIINESGNPLPEVVVTPYDITGNVTVDVYRLPVTRLPDTLESMDVQNVYYEIDAGPDYQSPPQNVAMNIPGRFEQGMDFARLFKDLVVTTQRDKREIPDAAISAKVRAVYDDAFFKEYLNIKLENITDFIYYASDNGLNEKMLTTGNELELIDFLVVQSRKYKNSRSGN